MKHTDRQTDHGQDDDYTKWTIPHHAITERKGSSGGDNERESNQTAADTAPHSTIHNDKCFGTI